LYLCALTQRRRRIMHGWIIIFIALSNFILVLFKFLSDFNTPSPDF
jgi:hypothetical protein